MASVRPSESRFRGGRARVGPRERRRLGLRSRATAAFGLVALVLSLAIAVVVWTTVSGFLMGQREHVTLGQAIGNAEELLASLPPSGADAPELLARLSALSRSAGSTSLLRYRGEWFASSLQIRRDELPAQLRDTVTDGRAARQRLRIDGVPSLVVGVPLPGRDAAYFEVFPLRELDATFRALSLALTGAVVAGPVLGMLLGRWAVGRALRPLDEVTDVARAFAAGRLGARIDPGGDPDLAPLAASFNATATALERRVRTDARFAADVSHELRSPLTTMLNALAVLQGGGAAFTPRAREALDLLAAETQRFERLVADLLEISRVEAGSTDLVLEAVRVGDLVRQATPPAQRHLVRVPPDAASALVEVDKRRFERVVANLVDNAGKHGGGLAGVAVEVADGRVRICVDDRGPGVAPAERESIFLRFARGSGTARDSSPGAGLGLALVAQHVGLLGGTVAVEDRPGGGARFVVDLPRAG